MYNDYTVTYESNINEFLIPILIGLGILIIMLIICLIAMIRIFRKANRSGMAAIIPIYNIMVMLEIINKPKWQIILFLIPIVNIVIYFELMFKIAKSFRKTDAFAIGTIFLPFIFLPILGFSDSEYMGINKEAMTGISIAMDVPEITKEQQEATPVAEKKQTKPLDISIGGGVYQKEYEKSLLEIPESERKDSNLASFRIETVSTPSPIVEEKEKTGADLLMDVNFIETTTYEKVPPIEPSQNVIETPQDEKIEIINTEPIIPDITNTPNAMNKIPEYIPCPHCGAKIPENSPRCFLCGKEL